MNKRNFLHNLIDMVEHELEATLAVLIVLAAVVGYSLAATESTLSSTSGVTAQQADIIMVNGTAYDGIRFDSSFNSSFALVRKFTLSDNSPSDLQTIKGSGLTAGTPDLKYEFSFSLSTPYSGSLYAIGNFKSGEITVNGTSADSQSAPIQISGADKITLTLTGTARLRALSTKPYTATSTQSSVASVFVIPTTDKLKVGEDKQFSLIATDIDNKVVVNPTTAWSINATPSDAAKINLSTGVLTATAPGVVVVTATSGGKKASATITIEAAPAQTTPTASYPGADETAGNTKTPATTNTTKTADTTKSTDTASKSILEKLAETLAPTTDAATPTPTKTQNSWNTDWGANGYFKVLSDELAKTKIAATATPTKVAAAVATAVTSPAAQTAAGSTHITQPVLNKITSGMTFSQKIATTAAVSARELGTTLKEIAAGNENTGKPSAPKVISNFVLNLLGLKGNVGASPMRGEFGEETDNE